MDVPFLLSEAQMRRIEPFFPLSHGIPRVDDRRIISGIVYVKAREAMQASEWQLRSERLVNTVDNALHAMLEQAVNLRGVNAAVSDLDKGTQQNAALIQEAASAAQALATETRVLVQLSQRFQLSGGAAEALVRAA